MKRILMSLVVAFGLFAAALAPAASAADCASQYTVKPGDNLFRIGLAVGVSWTQIAAANNLSNPSLIFPGQVLCIPSGTGTPAPSATGPTPTASATVAATAAATATKAPTATPGAVATGQPAPTAVPTAVVVPSNFLTPTFTIQSVVRDTSVTIQTANFPANQDFVVSMGPLNGQAVGGVVAGTTNSAAGGTFTATYSIPASLAGLPQISIRMQSASGYYSFNWFWNATAP